MIQRTERHLIIWKLLSGGICLLLLITSLSGMPLCRADNNEIAVSQLEDGQLEPGKLIERELAGDEIHSYRVVISAGQFLHVIINQQGIDVSVNLFSPDGKKLLLVNKSNDTQGSESILFIAQAGGSYRIEVQSLAKGAQAGRYTAKMHELRAATSRDSKQITAMRTFDEAHILRLKRTTESYRSALEKYYEAWPLMKDLGYQGGEAYTLYYIGEIYYALQDNQKALEPLGLALPLSQAIKDSWLETAVLGLMANIYRILGDKKKALECYNLALPLRREAGDQPFEAIILSGIGLVYSSIGEYQKALEHYSLSLSIFDSLKDSWGQASLLNNIGLVYDSLGGHQKALEYYSQALPLRRKAGDKNGEAITLNNMGASYRSLEEYQKALEHYGMALRLLRVLGNKRVEATTLSNIGIVHAGLGEYQKALEHYSLALPISQAVGDSRGQAIALKNIGLIHASSGDSKKALDYYNQSLRRSLDAKDRNLEGTTRYLIARAQRSQNNLVEARSSVEAALDVVESLRTKVASSELRASYFASVQQQYDFYIDLLMRLDQLNPKQGYQELALQASERARARVLLEMLAEARVDIHQGVEPSLLERERSLKQLLDAKTEIQVRLLSREHTKEQAEQIDKEVKQMLAQYQEVQDQIKLKSPGYAALMQPHPLTLPEIRREVVDADTLLLEYALGEEQSYLWAVTQDSIFTFQLPKRAEIEEAAQRVYDLISVDQRNRPSHLDSNYTKAVSALSRIVLGPVAAHLRKKRLLIVPQGALSYIPFAALPLPAVQKPANAPEPLIAKHEIIYLPSASTLAVLRRELAGRKLPPKAVAVIADPVFSKDDVRVRAGIKGEAKSIDEKSGQQKDEPIAISHNISQTALLRSTKEVGLGDGRELPRLPFSREEALAIFALGQQEGATNALDFNASRETATSAEMGQYRIVHFATHSLLNNEHPELSGLVLSLVDKHGQPQNGFLRLYDIYNLRLGADLVVLSACQTALGKQIKGEGLVGVTRGFMYSGAARVMASLWKVDDEATAELMKRLYMGMMKEKQKPAAALREAQLWMRKQKRWQSPYYWSGFILQGEWR